MQNTPKNWAKKMEARISRPHHLGEYPLPKLGEHPNLLVALDPTYSMTPLSITKKLELKKYVNRKLQ